MATQSLYRRYRPRRFDELKGQDHVVRALRNAVINNREGQAYLFSGPRGTGKTSTARILAKVLNCEKLKDGEPCGKCNSCVSIDVGSSYDVLELDAASNNGVDNMRDLIERAALGNPGRHRVFILDEVHMLSKPAEAALLKNRLNMLYLCWRLQTRKKSAKRFAVARNICSFIFCRCKS